MKTLKSKKTFHLVTGERLASHGGGRGVFMVAEDATDSENLRRACGLRVVNLEPGRFFYQKGLNFFSVEVTLDHSVQKDAVMHSAFATDGSEYIAANVSCYGTDDPLAVALIGKHVFDNQRLLNDGLSLANFGE
jgi:hypothetical protein